jgi:two-component system OmpR family sensor kinase
VGRLFWKFFAFIWLAQLAGIVAIGSAFWLTEPRFGRTLGILESRAADGARIEAAAAIFHYAGLSGFKNWVEHDAGQPVFAVDEAGHDVLGRHIAPDLLAHVRELEHESLPEPRGAPPVREVLDADSHRYRLFSVEREPADPPGRPGAPPERAPRLIVRPRGKPPLPPIIATLLASVATAFGLAWYVAKPIRNLRIAFDAVAGGDLEVRVVPLMGSRQDELADLGRDFDRMTARLQTSMNGQRRLLHDVSHEMRSPLARLQAAVGLIRRRYGQQDAAIERFEEEIERIDRLVGDLLNLSRIEAGELAGLEEDVDMQELVREIVSNANFEAHALQRAVTWEQETEATVSGRPDMLHGAIENVVRNALKHAPESREVRIETSIDAVRPRYTLRVLDTGPGVPEQEMAALFTPFFRATDAARREGYGLGLAIARRSIEAHGGFITAANRPEGGFAITIVLPLSPSAAPAAS